jgi:hypothetical protein
LKPLKIVYIIRTFNTGGAEKLLLHWIQYIYANQSLQMECRLVIWQSDSIELAKQLPDNVVKIFNIWPWNGIAGFLQLRRWLKKYCPDIVHSHLPASGLLSILIKKSGIKFCSIYSEHSLVNRKGFSFRLHGLCYHYHNSIHFVSHQVKQVVDESRNYRYRSFLLLPSVVPPQAYCRLNVALQNKRLVIGTLANFRKVKQIPEMVALMAKIEHAFPNSFSFVIAGDGPDRVNIQQAIVQHGMQQKIALLGKQENAAEFLAGIDVYLMTSSTEGLPLTLIEALQQGCFPAIAIQSKLTEIPLDKMGVRFALDNPKPDKPEPKR